MKVRPKTKKWFQVLLSPYSPSELGWYENNRSVTDKQLNKEDQFQGSTQGFYPKASPLSRRWHPFWKNRETHLQHLTHPTNYQGLAEGACIVVVVWKLSRMTTTWLLTLKTRIDAIERYVPAPVSTPAPVSAPVSVHAPDLFSLRKPNIQHLNKYSTPNMYYLYIEV